MPVQRKPIQSVTDDSLFTIDKNYDNARDDLLKFVAKQVDLMNSNLLFAGQDVPSFYALNKSLCEYESIMLSLTVIHNELRIELDLDKEKYEDFYAEKFCDEKIAQTNLGKQAQFTSTKEIDMQVRNKWMKELSKLKAEMIKTENELNFINHLVTNWQNYQFILSTLSKNAQAEASASGVSNRNQPDFGD